MIDKSIKKVLVIGSGPIIIGQAAEFDYAGTQACRSLKEEGVEVVLVNSNPATIMTDGDIADKVYIEPLTIPTLTKIIEKEKPDSILPTLGGQTGLNLAMELEEIGVLRENGVRLIGINADAIKKAEDRQSFKDTMEKIGEPCIDSLVVETVEDAVEFSAKKATPQERVGALDREVDAAGAQGVIFYTHLYDEVACFDMPKQRKSLESRGIRHITFGRMVWPEDRNQGLQEKLNQFAEELKAEGGEQ